MAEGVTGTLAGEPLSRTATALIAGNGTPSHDIDARIRHFPGPQFGRWRAGLSTDRLMTAVPSSAIHTFRDGKMGSTIAFENATFTRSTRRLVETGIATGVVWTPDVFVCIQARQSGWVPGVFGVEEIVDDDTVVLAGAPEAFATCDGDLAWSGGTINLTNSTWDPVTYRFTNTGAFVSYVWTDGDTYTPTSGDGGWFFLSPYTRDYLIRRRISDHVIELEPFGTLPADNAGATGYLGIGIYAEPYNAIGAPMGSTGAQNQFNLPAVTQAESFAANQSKYWDYSTDLPPGALAGGARCVWRFGGRAKFAYLPSRPTNDSDGDGLYDQTGDTTVVLTLDPWSSPFVSFIKGHSEGVYRETRKSRIGWTPDRLGDLATFEDDGSGNLRVVFPSRHSATVTDGTLVYLHASDITATLPDDVIEGQGYYVDSLSGGGAGKFALYHDKALLTPLSSSGDLSASVTMSRGSQGSMYQITCQFSVQANQVTFRDAACDAAGDTIDHDSLASRNVGDRLFCIGTGGAGFTINTDYWITSKPTSTTATLSATHGGGTLDITADSQSAAFLWTDPARINLEDYMRVEFEVIAEADGTSDNDETGLRYTGRMRLTPFGESVGGFGVGAVASRNAEDYSTAISRTLPGKSNSFTGTAIATGAPMVLAKDGYYTDGTYSFDAFVTTKFDFGGLYDILHLNGRLYYASLATLGEYSYPLVSVQGGDVDGQSSSYRRATNTLVYRGDDTTPIGEVVFHDDARQLCAVRPLVEGERIIRGDELTFKTFRYVRVSNLTAVAWDPTTRTLSGTNKFTAAEWATGYRFLLNSLAYSNVNVTTSHSAQFTPGVMEVESKTSDSAIVLTTASAALLPPVAVTSAEGSFSGTYPLVTGTTWGFEPDPIQTITTIKGPKFDTAAYNGPGRTITETGAFTDWTWFSGATVLITAGGSYTNPSPPPTTLPLFPVLPALHEVLSGTDDVITLESGAPSQTPTTSSSMRGQLNTNIRVTPEIVDFGPQMIRVAPRIVVTGPPDGSCEVEINTYHVELLDAGSR